MRGVFGADWDRAWGKSLSRSFNTRTAGNLNPPRTADWLNVTHKCFYRYNQKILTRQTVIYLLFLKRLQFPGDTPPWPFGWNPKKKNDSCCTFLEVYIDGHLRFDLHLHYVVKKISKENSILYRIRNYFDQRTLVLMYYCLIFTNITYCISG